MSCVKHKVYLKPKYDRLNILCYTVQTLFFYVNLNSLFSVTKHGYTSSISLYMLRKLSDEVLFKFNDDKLK